MYKMSSPRNCEVCENQANLLRCSRCKLVYYCSKEHQKKDWKKHKHNCQPQTSTLSKTVYNLPNEGSSESEILNSETENLAPNPEFAKTKMPIGNNSDGCVGEPNLCLNASIIRNQRIEDICLNVVKDLNNYGVCMVDNFLGIECGKGVLNEVLYMYKKGLFRDGELVSNKGDPKTIRGDQITWVNGREKFLPYIGELISTVDAVIKRANTMKNNGKLGQYNIKGRTKAMVACYPGSGSHYVQHVDNPHRDGRCITAIYYLNLGWDVKRSGGLLRIFSGGPKGDTIADVEPLFDRLLFFWSDWRNPHEVQPAYHTRYAITLWYFDAKEREEALRIYEKEKNLSIPQS